MEEQDKGSKQGCSECQRALRMATRAMKLARRNEQRLDRFLYTIGARVKSLPMEEGEMRKLDTDIRRMLRQDLAKVDIKEVLEWARVFLALDSNYLALCEEVFERRDPWYPWVELSDRMMGACPVKDLKCRQDLAAAYGYLDLGRKNVSYQSFFYCRNTKGSAAALTRFPVYLKDPRVTRAVIGLIQP